jgi:flagellar basal body-associated protein FliL
VPTPTPRTPTNGTNVGTEKPVEEGNPFWVWIIVAIAAVLLIGGVGAAVVFVLRKKKAGQEKKKKQSHIPLTPQYDLS